MGSEKVVDGTYESDIILRYTIMADQRAKNKQTADAHKAEGKLKADAHTADDKHTADAHKAENKLKVIHCF